MGTVAIPIDIVTARADTANTPEYAYIAGTNFPVDGYAFPQSSAKAIYIKTSPVLYGNSGNWTLDIHFESRAGSTTGTVQWTLAVAAVTPGDAQSIETKAFATSQNVSAAINATGKGLTLASATLSNLDSANAGDVVWIKVTRTDTSMVGDAIIQELNLSYSDGQTGTAGSGDVVGPASATTTALARYNGTTGKLIQNSAVSCDASGNLTGVGTINGAGLATFTAASALGSAFTSTTGTTLQATGLSVSLPASGTYVISSMLAVTISAATTMTYAFSASANFTSCNIWMRNPISGTTWTDGFQVANTTAPTGVARTTTTVLAVLLQGTIVVSGACTLTLQSAHTGAQTYTVQAGSEFSVAKV